MDVELHRNFVPGGTYFFTVNLAERGTNDLLIRHIDALRDAVRATRETIPFEIIAWVVLPEHMHAIWKLPDNDHDFSTRWAAIKARFSRAIPKQEFISSSRVMQEERGIWQRRFMERTIRDDRDLQTHIDYIHFNPVKHEHVLRPRDWPYSSFHRYVRDGVLPIDWASPT